MQASKIEFKIIYNEENIPHWNARFEIPEMSWGGWADSPLKALDILAQVMTDKNGTHIVFGKEN